MGFWLGRHIEITLHPFPSSHCVLEIRFVFLAFLVWQICGVWGQLFLYHLFPPPCVWIPVWIPQAVCGQPPSSPANRDEQISVYSFRGQSLALGKDPKMLRWSLLAAVILDFPHQADSSARYWNSCPDSEHT